LLVVCVKGAKSAAPTATFAGNAMTEQVTNFVSSIRQTLFTYTLGNSGTATVGDIVATGSGLSVMSAKSYHNVDQTIPVDNAVSAKGFGTNPSLTVTSEINDLVCDCLMGQSQGTFTSNQTTTFNSTNTKGTIAGSHKAGGATVSMSWTKPSMGHVHLGINLNNTSALPVELTTFEASATPTGNYLTWQTASELNNAGFEIERSTDAKTWEILDLVTGNGTSLEAHDYEYIDVNPKTSINYYRLKQIDFDGQFEYSKTVVVSIEKSNTAPINIYPNPVQDNLTVENGQGMITVFNTLGQKVRQFENQLDVLQLNVNDLNKGQYILHIQKTNGEIVTRRFVK